MDNYFLDCNSEELKRIATALEKIAHCVCKLTGPKQPVSSTLTFGGKMPASIAIGGTINAIYTEFDGPGGTGNVVPPTGAIVYSSDNPAVAVVDASSGMCTGISAGTANISANDSGLASPGLPASDVLSVAAAPPVAVSATLTFSGASRSSAVRGPSRH